MGCHCLLLNVILEESNFTGCGSAGKESTCNVGDLGLIPVFGRSPGEGKGYPFWCFGLENSMYCTVHGVAKSQDTTEQLSLLPCLNACNSGAMIAFDLKV